MSKELIFKELDKRNGSDLITAYAEVKNLSGLSDKEFKKVYDEWYNSEVGK